MGFKGTNVLPAANNSENGTQYPRIQFGRNTQKANKHIHSWQQNTDAAKKQSSGG